MKTLLLKVNPHFPDPKKIQPAADIIRHGGLVAFPTETVYGLGADAFNGDAILRLFEAKKRPLDNPPIIHIANTNEVYPLVMQVSQKAERLMEQFWPGPLTIIFKHSSDVPKETVAGLDTIAIRIPKHKVAQTLLRQTKHPIAAPSANLSGKPSPTTVQHVLEDLNGRIDAAIDGGDTDIGVESTVIDLSVDPPILLRPGGTPYEALKAVMADLKLHPFVQTEIELPIEKALSPGMKHKHYAPKAEIIIVEGNPQAVTAKISALTKSFKQKGHRIGVLATNETQTAYQADIVKSLGSRSNLASVAQNLFRLLREVDAEGIDVIFAEGVPTEGMGLAVMNRLRKASGYHIIKAE
ncbi:MAG: threonylcarbamoyl-AMP synthase [Nitrososphaerota archaeon]|jgi:L-threonylcarbamoyladenylate synthase|uniref:L-threonylcarbamoyladenylate synthase n=1 Tax=Candidatus Bathycorpusculum sp. TaxID=2994959 RepID=UPI00282FCBB2|nr:L-threonylcarbamoyladenylate synthase [Candidatus Termitimicrobium sp.]MCL2431025.1 L-threonylcarbamoyladenylate synthase [Candidatus Termitimicrobium sp.]MDR0493730.1 threonylcarbamoyl-AMP synthase [Nitrososphaerota archaeon]